MAEKGNEAMPLDEHETYGFSEKSIGGDVTLDVWRQGRKVFVTASSGGHFYLSLAPIELLAKAFRIATRPPRMPEGFHETVKAAREQLE